MSTFALAIIGCILLVITMILTFIWVQLALIAKHLFELVELAVHRTNSRS